MGYVVDTTLWTAKTIAAKLAAGELTRWGGVIRVAQGMPGAGQIVAHLRDASGLVAPGPFPPAFPFEPALQLVKVGSGIVQNIQLHGISKQLTEVMQLTQVAAAASVLNLGVSVVGFTVMNHKLNKLKSAISAVGDKVDQMRRGIDVRFDGVEQHLIEIKYIAARQERVAERLESWVTKIREAQLDDKLADILSWGMRLADKSPPDEADLREGLHAFRRNRIALEQSLGRGVRTDEQLLDELRVFRLWCMAANAEVMVLRHQGRLREAADRALEVAHTSRRVASGWCQMLMPAEDLGGAFRLGHTAFTKGTSLVTLESRRRLARLQLGRDVSEAELHAQSVDGAVRVAASLPKFSSNWFEVQASAAQLMDFAEETCERFESLAEETEYCARRNLGFDQWASLPVTATSDVDQENQ